MTEPTIQQLLPDNASSADTNGPQSNASATVSYPGVNNYSHVLSGVAWSYSGSGTLAGGNLQVLAFPDGFPNQGGLPIQVDGHTIGGIACSGAASEVDEAISQTAIDALLKK